MDRLEQEIRKRLAKSTSMEGVNNQDLWNAISNGSYPTRILTRKRKIWFIGLLLSAGVIGSIWSLLTLNEDSSSAYSPRLNHELIQHRSFDSQENQEHETQVYSSENNHSPDTNYQERKEESADMQITEHRAIHTGVDGTEQESKSWNEPKFSEQSKTSGYYSDYADQNREEDLHISSVAVKNEDLPVSSSSHSVTDKALSETTDAFNDDRGTMQRLNPLHAKHISISFNQRKTPIPNRSELSAQRKQISWEIHGGAVLLYNTFKEGTSGFAKSLNNNLSTEIGYLIGGLVRIKKGGIWNVRLGLEYMEWRDRFDKIILSDTLVQIDEEPISGLSIRTVRHFNEASIITLPVQFEIYEDIKRIRLAMNLGASYSFILSQYGRLLEDEFTVVNYSQDKKRFNNFISVRLAPSVGIKLNEKVLLNATCNIGIQGHGTSPINQMRNHSLTLMPSVGLRFNY